MKASVIGINLLALLAALFLTAYDAFTGTLATQGMLADMDRAECFNPKKLDAHMIARHGSPLDVRGPEFAQGITGPSRGRSTVALVGLILLSLANIAVVCAWVGADGKIKPTP